jgi:hypothetical protein
MFRPTLVMVAVFTELPPFVRLAVFAALQTFVMVAVLTELATFVAVAVITGTDAGRTHTYFVCLCRSRPDHETQCRTQQYNLHRALLGDAHVKPSTVSLFLYGRKLISKWNARQSRKGHKV